MVRNKKKKIIGCSVCNEKFSHGSEYRKHWLKEHLEFALKYAKNYDKYVKKDGKLVREQKV